jgi:hypothetical protein
MAKELTTTINVDGEEYNVNAVTANSVNNALTITKCMLTTTSTETFDGSESKTIEVVPAKGGTFGGKIRVPKNLDAIQDTDVLNYSDIKTKIVNELLNNALLGTWQNGKLQGIEVESTTGTNLKSICIITGNDADKNTFAVKNYNDKKLSAFIYVSTDTANKGRIYFGTAESSAVAAVSVSAENAVNADKAGQLKNSCNITTNLASSSSASFNGTQSTLKPGVEGILPIANGGTGTNSLSNITVGAAAKLANGQNIRTKLNSSRTASFDGTKAITPGVEGILPVTNGGTGQSNLANVTVGKASSADKLKVSGNYVNFYASRSAPTSPVNGDIWIQI